MINSIKLTTLKASVIVADEFRLRVILNNLLSNAIKFQRDDEPHPRVVVKSEVHPDGCILTVQDNGEGIAPEYLSKIFDMFYRASERTAGSGLGLYIAKEAAEKMGGRLSVSSVVGEGTTFQVFIPQR